MGNEVKGADGKVIDKAEVKKQNEARKKKAEQFAAEYKKKQEKARAEGKILKDLVCPVGTHAETGAANATCSGVGSCAEGKSSGKARCACDMGYHGRACHLIKEEKEELKTARKNGLSVEQDKIKAGKLRNAKDHKEFMNSFLAD